MFPRPLDYLDPGNNLRTSGSNFRVHAGNLLPILSAIRFANRRVFLLMMLMLFSEEKRIAAHRAFPGIVAEQGQNLPLQEPFPG
jgi:hypothetical protein